MASPPHSVEVRTPGDSPRPTAALLSLSMAAPKPSTTSRLLLLLTAALAAVTAFVLLRPPVTVVTAASAVARPLSKLSKPVVLLISSDGFRFRSIAIYGTGGSTEKAFKRSISGTTLERVSRLLASLSILPQKEQPKLRSHR